MRTKTLSYLFSSLAITSSLCAAGCAIDESLPQESELAGQSALIVLGDGGQPGSAIERISSEFDVRYGDELGLSDKLLGPDGARRLLAGQRGLAVDLAAAGEHELANWRVLFDAAMDEGVPLIVEHVDDARELSDIAGIGVEADLVLVHSEGNFRTLQVYGDNNVLEEHFADSGEPIPVSLTPTPGADLDAAVVEITERLRTYEPAAVPKAAGTYYYFKVDFSTYSWLVDGVQTATLNLDFDVELVADQVRNRKYVIFGEAGSGNHPGTLIDNGSHKRGYFQESATVNITPTTNAANVDMYAHAPATSNNSSTYTSTTGWGIDVTAGSDGASTTLSYDSSTSVSTTLTDFTAINNTAGATASWVIELNAVDGHSYNSWQDLVYWPTFKSCRLYSLPNLAKSNLLPEFEAIYDAAGSYTGTVTFQVQSIAKMRWTKGDGSIVTCNKSTEWWTLTRTKNVSVNFNNVAI